MQFAVYDAETGGNQLLSGSPWSETQSVTVIDGLVELRKSATVDDVPFRVLLLR